VILTVKMPRAALQECLAALRPQSLQTVVVGLGGRAQSRDYCSYLWQRAAPRRLTGSAAERVRIYFGTPNSTAQSRARLAEFLERCRELDGHSSAQRAEAVLLLLGRGRRAGHVEGAVYRNRELYPLDRCQVLPADPLLGLPSPIQPVELERYSRVIGGLGTDVWGEPAWPRLRDARWCLIGAGRGGTALAMLLARQGALYLTITDPDRIEAHNLDGLPAPPSVIGSSKAEILAYLLERFRPEMTAYPIPHNLATLPGMAAAWEADIVVSLVDSHAARLVASGVASAYLKPHLDIGQSVVVADGRRRELGVDVRLIVPGQGCLRCIGGAGGLSLATSMDQLIHPPRAVENFREERAGSLASLASIAVGLGMRLVEDMLVGVRTESAWLRLVQRGATMDLREIPTRPGRSCPICSRLMGLGDDAPLVGRRAWGHG
jgi:molybdopterin/thiamine biosynthesis adenylyltransferase